MIKMITLNILCFGISMNHIIALAHRQNCSNVSETSTSETLKYELGINLQLNETAPPRITNLTEKEELLLKLNKTENQLYQLGWKVIIKQRIDNYEAQFDDIELAKQVEPIFQLNETLIKQVYVTSDYDRLAERRTQKWLFYLEHPTHWASFENLVQRVNDANNCTSEEFCRGLAILYKRISHDILVEAMNFENNVDNCRSVTSFRYADLHFVIGLILEDRDIPLTQPIWNVLHELEIFDHNQLW